MTSTSIATDPTLRQGDSLTRQFPILRRWKCPELYGFYQLLWQGSLLDADVEK